MQTTALKRKKMNLTLEVYINDSKDKYLTTFYKVDALSKNPKGGSIIFLAGVQYKSSLPYENLWDKLKKLQNK
jgi:hypothetical protein